MNKVNSGVFTQIRNSAIYIVFACLFLMVGCSDDGGSTTVTVGDDVPGLVLPAEFKTANPNVRANMTPAISYQIDSGGMFVQLSSEQDIFGVYAVDASQLMVTDTQSYQVQVIWSYPQDGGDPPIDLGTVTYEVSDVQSDGMRNASVGTAIFTMESTNPADLNNLQLLNSLYRGDDVSLIEASLDLPNDITLVFDYIADYEDSSENIDYVPKRVAWGVDEALKVSTESNVTDQDVIADFSEVTFSAINNNSEIYFQLNNTDPDRRPFEYPVQVSIGEVLIPDSPVTLDDPTEITSDGSSSDETFETATDYAFRRPMDNRLDFRQLLPTNSPPVRDVKISFFSKTDSTMSVANWEGAILFRDDSAIDTGPENILNLAVLNEGDRQTNNGRSFNECTPFIVSPDLNGETDPTIVVFTYGNSGASSSDFIFGNNAIADVNEHELHIKLPPTNGVDAYTYTITVNAVRPEARGDVVATQNIEFTVNVETNPGVDC